MTEEQIDEELEAIEYALDKAELIINELEDIDYWKSELEDIRFFMDKLYVRQAMVEEEQNLLWKKEKEGY